MMYVSLDEIKRAIDSEYGAGAADDAIIEPPHKQFFTYPERRGEMDSTRKSDSE